MQFGGKGFTMEVTSLSVSVRQHPLALLELHVIFVTEYHMPTDNSFPPHIIYLHYVVLILYFPPPNVLTNENPF